MMREKGLKEKGKEREAPTHLIELARFSRVTKVALACAFDRDG